MSEKASRFISTIKIGPKGQIVIPKEIREMFGIESGDSLLIMADSERGIAIHKQSIMEGLANAIFEGQGSSVLPREDPEALVDFAKVVSKVSGKGGKE